MLPLGVWAVGRLSGALDLDDALFDDLCAFENSVGAVGGSANGRIGVFVKGGFRNVDVTKLLWSRV